MCSYPVIICAVNVSGHSEVSYFNQETIPHQTVSCCQVTVHKVLGCQVDHSCSDLTRYVKHLGKTQLPVALQSLSIHQNRGVWPMGSEKEVRVNENIRKQVTLKRI